MRILIFILSFTLWPAHAHATQDALRGVMLNIGEDGALTADVLPGRGYLLRDHETGWPGEMLRVVARDEAGQVVAEGFVQDPRFIRYEGWNADGTHQPGSNRSFIQDYRPLLIRVSLPESAAAVEIYESPAAADAPAGEALLAQGAIQLR